MTKFLLSIVTVAAAGGAGWVWTGGFGDSTGASLDLPGGVLHTVTRSNLVITVVENGTMMARDSRRVSPGFRGRGQIEWLIPEGAVVEEGELIARLDTLELEKDVEEIELELLQVENTYENALSELEIQKTDNEANLEKAQLDLEKATKELEKYQEGDSEKERRTLRIGIADALTEQKKAERQATDSEKLFEKEYITKIELEEHQIALDRANVKLESAEKDQELYELYTYPLDLRAKETALRDAERALDTAAKRAASQLRQKEVNVEQAKKRLERYTRALAERKSQIERFTMKAPCRGIVLYGDPHRPWDRDDVRVGEDFWGRETLMTIPDLRVMLVKVHVHEADVNKLAKDQVVRVTMDTYPGQVITGSVTRIASIADDASKHRYGADVKRFSVEITLEPIPGLEFRPGVSAKAQIFVQELPGVLSVPLQCVFLDEGRHKVWVLVEGEPQMRRVTSGPNNETSVVIEEGLEEGDKVLLYNPELPSDTTGDATEAEPGEAEGEAVDPGGGVVDS